ncbi:DFP2-like protein [Euroglyphus maynei]|uniref:DFP2-like protein n=1 Tax=Euroglyphus maynei TaxID=6958 RepID=A0A1Y3BJU9_EURMA|nr:DFP2-like protein [Euroglyphus maynei]
MSYSTGGGSFGSSGGSLPGPMSLYSYAPRRANAAVYGGIWGPQTNEEALKFDSHLTRSMIADVLASSGRRLYAGHGGLIPAAIQSRRNIQFYDVPSNFEAAEPITVEVGQSPAAQLNIRFKSSSSPLAVEQDHSPAPGSMRETSSEDEPHVLRHTVSRPIFQEVHEVIKPFRRVTQEIQPVQENVETVVARGDEIQGAGLAGTILTADSGEVSGGQTTNLITGHGGSAGQGYVQGISAKPASYGSGSYTSGMSGGQHIGAIYSSKPKSYAGHGGFRQAGYGQGIAAGTGYQKHQMTGGAEMAQVQIPFARRAAAAASARGARRA